jgi:hypothetical protein
MIFSKYCSFFLAQTIVLLFYYVNDCLHVSYVNIFNIRAKYNLKENVFYISVFYSSMTGIFYDLSIYDALLCGKLVSFWKNMPSACLFMF